MSTAVKNGIDLFPHNQKAYLAASAMLTETGKAAIIHPTGTGKSFIGFKLAEDNPDAVICWLSPSEYIFKTQIENLKATGVDEPNNIKFFTYAKLMLMSEDALAEIQPDYIILDEFHRCGAELWGQGVQNLLSMYPDAPILGLSATAVRYLDNQRDMSDELFDGNVASEMTLGEAIVRGILNPPKYVLSVYSYQKDLEKYQARIKRAKSKAVRDTAQEYLDALRRALDKADGIDRIFEKHLTDKSGKYIIFCANAEHMDDMIGNVPKWFGNIDKAPNIYRAYSDDPETSKAFAAFKKDKSEHLKLLFCIDMLNEGVHVEDVSGVILLRPTISPIIYKQQIGRALSASKTKDAIIFDIVNNIENLYSISAIEQEIKTAVTYYRFLGDEKEIVNERFSIIDEVRDCKRLFDKLNDALTASWDLMYQCACAYYKLFGNLEVPHKYKTPEGYSLGSWIHTQRKVRAGEQYGNLDESRIAKLDAIGMVWDSYRDLSWERNYAEAKKYFTKHGDLNTNVNDVTESGFRIGQWICNLRTWRKSGIQGAFLTNKRIRLLDELHMIWDQPDYLFEQSYQAALDYYRENGHLEVPAAYVTKDGIRLGIWICNIRAKRNGSSNGAPLTEVQIARLDEIGMIWTDKPTRQWEAGFSEAQMYYESHGSLNVPATYKSPSGYRLGGWIADQRISYSTGKLKSDRKARLDTLGMIWVKPDSWEVRFALAKEYYQKNGSLNMPANYTADGIWIAKWLNEQRQIYIGNRKNKSLSQEQIARLDSIGMVWDNKIQIAADSAWSGQFAEASNYYEKHGDLNIPFGYCGSDGKRLDIWVICQRKHFRAGRLSGEQIEKLNAIGMVWEFDNPWETGFCHAKAYYAEYGDLLVPNSYVCADGYKLGIWITNQRSSYNNPQKYRIVTGNQAERLEAIGMKWRPTDTKWEDSFKIAEEYYKEHGDLLVPSTYKTASGYQLGAWISVQREKYRNGKLPEEATAKLNRIGMEWLSPNAREWERHYCSLEKYYKQHGNANLPLSYVEEDGFQLGLWLWRVKTGKVKMSSNGENGNQFERLQKLGITLQTDAVTDEV
ncbi:MAG: Helicase associated domain protein, partial [Eubacteriales bacterium]|nr:Helicase associated domain protein [Eubacteriales bacterium]